MEQPPEAYPMMLMARKSTAAFLQSEAKTCAVIIVSGTIFQEWEVEACARWSADVCAFNRVELVAIRGLPLVVFF